MKSIWITLVVATLASSLKPEFAPIGNLTKFTSTKWENKYGSLSTSTQCGNEVLDTEAGRIHYKLSEFLVKNERCIWLISVQDATGYSVGIFSLGFPSPTNQHKLSITSFQGNDPPETIEIDHLGMYDFNAASVLLITFHTGTTSLIEGYNGFMLEYTTYKQGSPQIGTAIASFQDASIETVLDGSVSVNQNGPMLGFFIWNFSDNSHLNGNRQQFEFLKIGGWITTERVEPYTFDVNTNWKPGLWFNSSYFDHRTVSSFDVIILLYRTSAPVSNHVSYFSVVNFNCILCDN